MTGSLSELRTWNSNRSLYRAQIVAWLSTTPVASSDPDVAIEVASMAIAAAGYQAPAPDPAERKRWIRVAVEAAETAMTARPQAAVGYYWFAVNRALELNSRGLIATLFGIGRVRRAAARAVELDEGVNHGGPLRIRGMLAFRLPGLLGGNKAHALADLERAVAKFPEFPENYLFLAQIQESMATPDAALATLERGLGLPSITDPEQEARWRTQMEALRSKLRGLTPSR